MSNYVARKIRDWIISSSSNKCMLIADYEKWFEKYGTERLGSVHYSYNLYLTDNYLWVKLVENNKQRKVLFNYIALCFILTILRPEIYCSKWFLLGLYWSAFVIVTTSLFTKNSFSIM